MKTYLYIIRHSSSYIRAIDTVKPLAEQLNMEITHFEELIERPIASVKYMISAEELLAGIEKSFLDLDYCLLEGETTRQAQERAIPVIKQLLTDYKGKKIVIGTHGNIMTIIMNYFNKSYGYDFWKATSKPDIYKLEFEEMELIHVERLWNDQNDYFEINSVNSLIWQKNTLCLKES